MGSGWAGLGWADPDTWHAMALPRRGRGLLLGCGPQAWSTVDASSRSMDLRQGPWWTKSIPLLSLCGPRAPGAWACGRREEFPLLPLPAYSRQRRAPGEPCQRCWRPIEVGKGLARPRRTRWWGLGDCQGFLQLWPRWSAARRGGARRRAPSSSAGVQLWWETARPYHGGCPGEASEVAGWLQLAGRGGGARRSSGRGPVLVVRALWPATGVSVYAANLQASR